MKQHVRRLADQETARGGVNAVTRSGHSVIRPAGPWTPAVHALLRHLEAARFPHAPRVLGHDARAGTETLSYLEGEVAMRPWPACFTSIEGVIRLGRLLKTYHAAVADFVPPPDAVWRDPEARWRPGLIIRHGDLGPWNHVWNLGELVGLVDWDFAEPGDVLDDLAQVAWYGVPLRDDTACADAGVRPSDRRLRLAALCEAYGAPVEQVLTAVSALQTRERHRIERHGRAGVEPWKSFLAQGHANANAAEARWLADWRRA